MGGRGKAGGRPPRRPRGGPGEEGAADQQGSQQQGGLARAQERPARGALQPRGGPGAQRGHACRWQPRVERRSAGSGRVLPLEAQQKLRRAVSPDRAGGQWGEHPLRRGNRLQPAGSQGRGQAELRRGGAPRHGRPCPRVGVSFLEELLQKEPSEVAITLASSPGLPEALSQTALQPRFLELLCQALRKACCSRMDRQSIQRLLGLVKESAFLRQCLPQYIARMLTEAVPAVRHQYPQHIDNIVALVRELASIFPASSIQSVAMLTSLLPAAVNALRASGVDFAEEIEQALEQVQAYVQHLQERRREGTLRVDSQIRMAPPSPGGEEEEEDYRVMSIFPTHMELHHQERPFLRPNTLSKPYEGPGVYLETHFRLLREDFVRPMREGIVQLLRNSEEPGLRQRRFDDIRVYSGVRILVPCCVSSGVQYKVQFDTKLLRSIRWENSKRLIYGSLVCLSKDNFETFLFATVAQRESQELQKGLVWLSFCEHSRPLLAEAQPTDVFLMVETTAYFEAYRHVLQGLQEVREEELPFQRHIVRCEADVSAPAYLDGCGALYDLSSLVEKPTATPREKQREEGDGPEGDPPSRHRGGSMGSSLFYILDPQQWPTKEDMGLDESQWEALRSALTKELAIIQGPPGTGKTYVGLKIVRALLANEVRRDKSPILVVCYTNHALDQFLEGIHAFQKTGIVRVGGRSNSESLKKFTLQELRRSTKFWKHLPRHLHDARSRVSSQMWESKAKLERQATILDCSLRGVLHERHLQGCMDSRHWESLTGGQHQDWMNAKHSHILEWLGLGATPFFRSAPGPDDADPAGTLEERGEEEEEEEEGDPGRDLVAIAEEAALIEAERLLDSEEADSPRRDRRQSHREAVWLGDLFLALSLEEGKGDQGPGARGNVQPGQEGPWQVQRNQRKKMKKRVEVELKKREGMSQAQVEAIVDLWGLDLDSRWHLYRHWLCKFHAAVRRTILSHEEEYQAAADQLAELRFREDLCVLQEAQVVGMTTTGAARYRQVLQQVAPRVVVVEEAAEVLEAHTITTLSRGCQHLILIGDHQQLRPSANVYDLAKNFNLEVSLFERLVTAGLPFVRLNFQHRMRPEIARLLTPHIYQDLENHPSVLEYENIKGVSSNLFFVEHTFLEQEIQDGKSHQNWHEAHFVVALCKYLLCQGYEPSQITILTTYTGQLFCLRRLLPVKTFQGVKVHVVDKYQGEENDIVLLSLVRSNPEGRVGFLQAPNRVCVALSRARKGLYCIGNLAMLSQVPLWSKILHALREKGQAGHALVLSCQNHPGTQTEVAQATDFAKVPEGGCNRPCEARLSCGHVCPRACHPYDPWHREFQCMKPCQKVLCPNGHRCCRVCYEPCGDCVVKVPKTLPRCGHQQQVPCATPAEKFCCQEPCTQTLQCGHKCNLTCGQRCTQRCSEVVLVTLQCGHSQEVGCSTATDLGDGKPVPCQTRCSSTLECGHPCPGSCHSCFGGRFHEPCRSPCTRLLICSHKCQQPCTSDCPPCQRPCENRCVHSRCLKTCGEPCPPCVEPCEWRCPHHQCSRLCSEPCDRPRCDAACPLQLPCGHPCAGVCGEPCPQKCLVCDHEELTQIFFGFEEDPGARFVQLEDCGHVFETQGLDFYMDGQREGEGEEEEGGEPMAVKLKVCPACQTPIRRNLRYGALVKRSLAEVEMVKCKIQGSPEGTAAGRQRLKAALLEAGVLLANMPDEYRWLQEKLDGRPALSVQGLGLLDSLVGFYVRLAELAQAVRRGRSGEWEGARRRVAEVAGWLRRPRLAFSGQELSELECEFRRLAYLVELLGRCQAVQGKMATATAEIVGTLRQVLEGPGKFTPADERQVKAKMEALKEVLPASGLAVSEAEKRQIVAAVTGTTRGHWFKCRNGHFYVIGECGGAMERGRCPECQETIGGAHHALDAGNQLAPEMDGAENAAWSQEANRLGLGVANWLLH